MAPATQQSSPFDPGAPLFVAKASVSTAAMGAFTGACIGVVQRQNPFLLGANMAVNSGIGGLAFFATREYVVSPALLAVGDTPGHVRRRAALDDERRGVVPPAPSIAEVRTERLLDSGIAGALSGGGLSAAMRGPKTLLPAAFTSALIATLLQFSVNSVRVARLEILAKRLEDAKAREAPVPVAEAEAFDNPLKEEGAQRGDAPITSRILGKLSSFLPVRKLTDEDYLATLERKRADVDKRLAEIDAEQLTMFERAQRHEQQHK
ncbi:hypothetical protein VHUM_00876 [Vanrija humicola]|uniref:Uncharacterized protein n=1 Tax=Vanrija humicola TaxID=5417 RepID=A0A7D8Z2U6_VANHU|nr:hypothetical protein VHUM_00876 [Vanrija humicola]